MPDPHYHLAWFGHIVCEDESCQLEREDPAWDMPCTHPDPRDCDGTCSGARFNKERRAHLWSPADP